MQTRQPQLRVMLTGNLEEMNPMFEGISCKIIARPKSSDYDEVFSYARDLAGEYFVGGDWYWHDSPDPLGGYFAQRSTGNTITIEQVR
jgi:hypothetical protein